MDVLIYSLDKLIKFRIDINFEKFLTEKNSSAIDIISNVKLGEFKLNKLSSFQFFLDRLETDLELPLLNFDVEHGRELDYRTNIGIFKNRIRFEYNKIKSDIVLDTGPSENDKRVKEKKSITMDKINEVSIDLNYLLGLVIGKEIEPDVTLEINGSINCSCEEYYYEKYLVDLTSITYNILDKENYKVRAITFDYEEIINEDNYILNTRIGNIDDEEVYNIKFSANISPPIKIYDMIYSLLNEMNKINNKLRDL
ncbi:MAG: hypothetical protein ACTSWE_03955 [Promethearchaeota archaeon]